MAKKTKNTTRKYNKRITKEEYIDYIEELIDYYSLEENRYVFDYKRKLIEKGMFPEKLRKMASLHPEIDERLRELKHIIVETLYRMILEGKSNKDAFTLTYAKQLFKDLTYHTPEEIAHIEKVRSETKLQDTQAEEIRIGYEDEFEEDTKDSNIKDK